jgi:8-oxo-dGTP pyrophosphatase MutT (NUDIX family)/phosphohistidine phosphatase SixA
VTEVSKLDPSHVPQTLLEGVPVDLAAELQAAQGPTVYAAGVVCWRMCSGRNEIEVLLVHQSRYGEWSWPKGKLEDGETLPECAVRETLEETGLVVRLGRPLPLITYPLPTGERKEVHVWTARVVDSKRRKAAITEIDDQRWVSLDDAEQMLAHPTSAAIVEAVRGLHDEQALLTTPILVLRHATSRPRDSWPRSDGERPLVETGRRQAKNLAGVLDCWQPTLVLTSPWRRCRDTLQPYLQNRKIKVRTKSGLAEDEFRRDSSKARKHLEGLLAGSEPAVLCTHRPVMGVLMPVLARWCQNGPDGDLAGLLPAVDPYLSPAEAIVAHVAHHPDGKSQIVALERHAALR